jgi:predicted RNA methylase
MKYSETQTVGLNRNSIDKYYTKEDVVASCLHDFQNILQINPHDLILEPSAGNGSFINGIKAITENYKFYDIEPEHNDIIKQDFLIFNPSTIQKNFEKIHIVGNPPFGRQSSSAIKFIKKSCEFCDSISFILPKSFKKQSLQRTFPLNFHLLFQKDLTQKSFLVGNIEHDVPCVFQIWQKKSEHRDITENLKPLHFRFVHKEDDPDISFRRVGINAGTIDRNTCDKSIQSHYFIKFMNKKSVTENLDLLSSIQFDFDNTVGPKSISKQELIYHFNPLLELQK